MNGSHVILCRFSCGSSILVELEFHDVGFCGGRKTREPREKPWELGRRQTRAILVGLEVSAFTTMP